jgi:hypothetical protein
MSRDTPTVGLCNDYPMRPDFLAQVVVPRDMTYREAKRLAAFIMALTEEPEPVDEFERAFHAAAIRRASEDAPK